MAKKTWLLSRMVYYLTYSYISKLIFIGRWYYNFRKARFNRSKQNTVNTVYMNTSRPALSPWRGTVVL